MSAGVIDQDAAHDPAADGEEVSAVLPVRVFLAHQFQVGFVHQRGAVEGMIRTLAPQLPVGDFVKLRVDQWRQLVDGGGIARAPRFEQLCDVSGRHITELSRIFASGLRSPYSAMQMATTAWGAESGHSGPNDRPLVSYLHPGS